jgi:hypothetical protein
MRKTALLAALILAVPLLWVAGEMHRSNCIREGLSACSVLPWENGEFHGVKVKPVDILK